MATPAIIPLSVADFRGSSPFINFTSTLKIDWSQFRELSTKKIGKVFVTSYKNVVYYWSINLGVYPKSKPENFGLFLRYEDGPLPTLDNVIYKITFFNSDNPRENRPTLRIAARSFDRNKGWGLEDFDFKDADAFQKKYGFASESSLICQVTVQIPMAAFSFKYDHPLATSVPPKWLSDLFGVIDDQEKSKFSNGKVVSRTGRIFYCHKVVLGFQSPALAAMFRHPLGEGQQENTYPFPTMGDKSLKAFLEFLYTGKVTLGENLTTTAIIETADAAELYGLDNLKESCRAALWNRAVAQPSSCFEIIRFADLHADFKYVKYRAFDVLAVNYFKLRLYALLTLCQKFGEDQRAHDLASKFNVYLLQRVQGHFAETYAVPLR